jgi:hypothetical protein
MNQKTADPPKEPEESLPTWHRLSNMGLTAASVATSYGFAAATRGTQLGVRTHLALEVVYCYHTVIIPLTFNDLTSIPLRLVTPI